MEQIDTKNLPRRIFTISLWPLIDFLLTILSNSLLAAFDAWVAVPVMAVVTSTFNLFFFYMLSKEKELPENLSPYLEKVKKWQKIIPGFEKNETLAILVIYTISGPAMVGAPLIWLLGIKGKRARILIIVGSILNAILWTGGIFNLFWFLVKALIVKTKSVL